MASPWKQLNNTPSFSVDTMLLLTDGSVMCHEYETPNWHKLVPDAKGDYVKGTWQAMTALPANAPLAQNGPVDAPLYYASAVLKDSRVFVAGGEYNVVSQVDLLTAQIYDPVADSWSSVPTPPGWSNIGDAPCCVLPDGKVLLGDINSTRTAIFDPIARSWSPGGNKDDNSSEESWTLLPNHTVLSAEVNNHPKAEKYVVHTNTWVSAGAVPAAADLVLNVPGASIEIGPASFALALPAIPHSTTSRPEPGPRAQIFRLIQAGISCAPSTLQPLFFRTATFCVWSAPWSRAVSTPAGRVSQSGSSSLTARP